MGFTRLLAIDFEHLEFVHELNLNSNQFLGMADLTALASLSELKSLACRSLPSTHPGMGSDDFVHKWELILFGFPGHKGRNIVLISRV